MTSDQPRTRRAEVADAAACRDIYAPYVEDSSISFEEQVPTLEQMTERIEVALSTHAWVVLEEPGPGGVRVVGYAYAGPYKERRAYRWSCEVSVYVERGRHRSGAGRRLYAALFEQLRARGYLMAVAGMALPNPASEGLHRALGFEDVGTWRRIGFKRGAWHDVHWMQKSLDLRSGDPSAAPPDPR